MTNEKKNELPNAFLISRGEAQATLMLAARLCMKTLRLVNMVEEEHRLRYAHKPSADVHDRIMTYCEHLEDVLAEVKDPLMAAVLCPMKHLGLTLPKYGAFDPARCESCPDFAVCRESMDFLHAPGQLLSAEGRALPKGTIAIAYADLDRMERDTHAVLGKIDALTECILLFLNDTPYTPRELAKILLETEKTYDEVSSRLGAIEYIELN